MPAEGQTTALWSSYKSILRARQKVIIVAVLISIVICAALQNSGSIESLENQIGRPTFFYIRDRLGLAPKLDPRILIYAYDDAAVREWGRPELLSGKQWGEIMGAITDHGPKTVFVDMIFGNPRKDPNDVAAMNRAFKRSVSIYTSAYVAQAPVKRAKPLNMTYKDFAANPEDLEFLKKYQGSNPTKTAYGPAENLKDLHRRVGHINFRVPGFFMPMVPFPPDKMLRHLALSNPELSNIKTNGTELLLNGTKIPLNEDGEAVLDWSTRATYSKNTYSILDLVESRRAGQYSNLITKDSIVLFLPLMFTGNADFKQTFVGQLVGGFVHATVINSVLSNKWIRVVDPAYWGLFIAVFAGFMGSIIRRNYVMIIYTIGLNLAFFLSCIALFIVKGWLVEWLNCLLAFNLILIPVIVFSEITEEIRSIRVNDALSGVLSPKMLEKINKSPEGFSLSAVEQVVTVMFVDFVGFSLVAERVASRVVFESLKKHFKELGNIIHKHHGIVDKSLGDGLLGVFGYDPVTRDVSNTHAEDAVLAAIEIQKLIARECSAFSNAADNDDKVIFASRVGLNTGTVFIGNIGEEGRLDLTVIGHTVNMGKRYEDACEPFKILLGPNTESHLPGNLRRLLTKRDIQIKHHAELIQGFEMDPFHAEPQIYNQALKVFRDFSKASRSEDRILINPKQVWSLMQGDILAGQVVDYSSHGVCADLKAFYGNKVALTFDLAIKSAQDGKILGKVSDLHATVKWGRKSEEGFRHGLSFTPESSLKFQNFVKDFASS